VPHYTEAFSVQEGRCFRFLHTGLGHATHCPEPVVARGTFIDKSGKRWKVDACEKHRGELDGIDGGEVG
jgi:hypothetical protein